MAGRAAAFKERYESTKERSRGGTAPTAVAIDLDAAKSVTSAAPDIFLRGSFGVIFPVRGLSLLKDGKVMPKIKRQALNLAGPRGFDQDHKVINKNTNRTAARREHTVGP